MAGDGVLLRPPETSDVDLLVEASRDADIIRWTRMPENLGDAAASELLTRWRGRARERGLRQHVSISPQSQTDPPNEERGRHVTCRAAGTAS
jgi:hypothetical protein